MTDKPYISDLPTFSSVDYSTTQSDLESILANNRKHLEELLAATEAYTWDNLMAPLDTMDDTLHRFWARVSHLNNVKNSDELRPVYEACIPLLSAYGTEMSHHRGLYEAVCAIEQSDAFPGLSVAQKKTIHNNLRDFRLAGVHLPADKKAIVAKLSEELAALSTTYSNHVLDATQAWSLHVTDEAKLAGIPAHVCEMAKAKAEAEKKEGCLFSLDFPIYYAVLSQGQDASVRESMYRAYVTRASDAGPNAGEFDNSPIMQAILEKRLALAKVLDCDTYAHYALATRMVKNPDDVMAFIERLGEPSKHKADEEFAELKAFSKEHLGLEELAPWDVTYAVERLREHAYAISQEALRPYFPLHAVMDGLFDTLQRLFGLRLERLDGCDTWHDDVDVYALSDSGGCLRSYCYIDCYARSDKRGGAWMDDLQGRRKREDGTVQLPIALVNCNFTPPDGDRPSLLTFDEVETLFHEFGHALQHMLTTVDVSDVAGISGIPWDAVEFPSQFMEHWAWDRAIMTSMAKHYQTGEALGDAMIDKMHAARHFQAAMRMVRQLEFAWFDMHLHTRFDLDQASAVKDALIEAQQRYAVAPRVEPYRFAHAFSHIFAGGYAAGYYSYKWAEVMAVDAFGVFESRGGFDPKTAEDFARCVLEPGGSKDPDVLFREFAGRDPDPMVLLRHDHIVDEV